MKFRIALVAALAAAVSAPAFAGPMSGPDIMSLLSGNTVSGSSLSKGYKFTVFYDASGAVRGKNDNGPVGGEWMVKGDKFCSKRDGKTKCNKIVDNGDGTYSKLNGKDKKVTLFSVNKGNPDNL